MHTFVIPMADGNDLLTVLVSVKNDTDLSFNRLFGDAADDKVVGFDTELDKDNIDYVHLLKKLSALLANRDIVFVGVRKRDDLAKLRNDYGLEISNFVELSELVVSVLGKPVLGTYRGQGAG
ncbi:hypothetical protein OIU76_016595 [Salix suchowensis]|nr:hypothetical protein OIU76_016595 [Salix suchowensis]